MWLTPDGAVRTIPPSLDAVASTGLAQFLARQSEDFKLRCVSAVDIVEELLLAVAGGESRFSPDEAKYVGVPIPVAIITSRDWERVDTVDGLVDDADPRWLLDWLRLLRRALHVVESDLDLA